MMANWIIVVTLCCAEIHLGFCGVFEFQQKAPIFSGGATYLPPTLPPLRGTYLPPTLSPPPSGSYLATTTIAPPGGFSQYLPPPTGIVQRSKYGFSFSSISTTEKPKSASNLNTHFHQQHQLSTGFSTFPKFNTFPALQGKPVKPKQTLEVPRQEPSPRGQTLFNSYDPQPSGVGIHLPTPSTPAPLPLSPKTVQNQFTLTSSVTAPKSTKAPPPMLPVITFDEPTQVLSPAENSTLYAAKLLASSLLQVSDSENDVVAADKNFEQVRSEAISENGLNRTDIVIVKSQKNAYIIPMKMSSVLSAELDPFAAEELYKKRNELQRAYTINQFLFIIKPQHINFLNKLA